MNVKLKLYLGEENNNLYAIICKASQVLKEAGHLGISQTMRHRVLDAPNYDEAMNIIGEYMEIYI